MRNGRARGFTLLELVIVVACIAILSMLAMASIWRQRPRATFASTVSEVRSLIHFARQTALATGDDVAVMVFPAYVKGTTQGRIVVYRDGDMSLFSAAAAVKFDDYTPETPKSDANSEVIRVLDLPAGVLVGPVTGMGAAAKLLAPLDTILVNTSCSFCEATDDKRGAIVFHASGHPDFYGAGADLLTPLTFGARSGESLSLMSNEVDGHASIVITSFAGSVLALQ